MHTVVVAENRVIAPDVHELLIEKPVGFSYVPGQFVVLQGTVEGKPMRRSYSLASAPHEERLRVTVKRQNPGRFSPFLCDLGAGEELLLLGPYGLFILRDTQAPRVFLAAGTGITPFRSFLCDHLRSGEGAPTLLIYSAQTPETLLYREELEALAGTLPLESVWTVTRPHLSEHAWPGHTGRITAELLDTLSPPAEAYYYLCGPTPMVVAVRELLLARGIPPQRIATEKFGNIEA